MIEITSGDILQADAEALVNTVNCVGVMGRGIALQYKKAFPNNFKFYKSACDKLQVHPGDMLVYDLNRFDNPRYIINFPTKRHWKGKSRIEDIESGLNALIRVIKDYDIHSVAIPPLGCGLGGLNWDEVRFIIEKRLQPLSDVRIYLYEPKGAPDPQKMVKVIRTPTMTIGRASLIGLVKRYLAAVLDPTVSLLEIHKLMFFMQEAGENLRLNYQKGIYGPYATNLRHVLSHIEGHFISGYGDGTDDPEIQIELKSDAIHQAQKKLLEHPDTNTHLDQVSQLIRGFETPYGMELLATVHWVATREQADTINEAIDQVYSWSDRKRKFQKQHIQIAWDHLVSQNWINDTGAQTPY